MKAVEKKRNDETLGRDSTWFKVSGIDDQTWVVTKEEENVWVRQCLDKKVSNLGRTEGPTTEQRTKEELGFILTYCLLFAILVSLMRWAREKNPWLVPIFTEIWMARRLVCATIRRELFPD
jgi:hypothetical protein